MKQQRLEELRTYFKTNVGPVFCTPSANLLHRYALMHDLIGIVKPLTPWQIKSGARLLNVDWSLNTCWNEMVDHYSLSADTSYSIQDIDIIKPGADVPQIAYEKFKGWNWNPCKLGTVVCISGPRLKAYALSYPTIAQEYAKLAMYVGVIVEKCDNVQKSAMVSFSLEDASKIINVPIEVLFKLPESFRPTKYEKKADEKVASKAKFSVGQIVRVGSSVIDETFMGLLGMVRTIHETEPSGFSTMPNWEYTVDFDLLPNRNLSLCEGESGNTDIITTKRLKERILDEWDEKVSDKPYFGLYRAYAKRDKVWVPHKNGTGTVKVTGYPTKSLSEGMNIEVRMDDDPANKFNMSCRDVDYKWDPDALLSVLSDSFVCLGIEQDERNPNVGAQQYVYMYVFDYAKDVSKYVKYRILLGTLLKKKSITKKFARALLSKKLVHPWQVYRYLQKNSLGYFYHLFTASEYIQKAGDFCYAE